MAREREIRVTVLGDSKGGQRALVDLNAQADRTDSKFDGLGSKLASFGKIAAVGIGGAAAGIGAFMVKATLSASDLGETMSKIGVVFGEAKDQVVADADFMAKSFGIPKQAFLDASASIGLIGKASGMAKGDVGAFSTGMARLATDAASFYNVPLEEALAAIQSGLIGEAEPMRKFGVLLSENTVKEEAYALGIAARGAELDEGQKVQARASLIMKGMSDATGDLERTQGSLANRIREIQGRLANFAAEVGERVVPAVLSLMDMGERFVQSEGFSTALARISEAGRAVVDWVVANWPQIQSTISEVLANVTAAVTEFVELALAIWARFGDEIVAYTQGSFTTAMEIIGGTLEAIRGVMAAATAIINGDWSAAWDGITQVLSGAWEAMGGIILQAMNIQQNIVAIGMEFLWSVYESAWAGIVDLTASIPGRIIGALGDLAGMLWDSGWGMMEAFANGIRAGLGNVLSAVRSVLSRARDMLPFSDAKTGPLKDLTLSGRRMQEAFATGIRSSSAITDAFESVLPALGAGGRLGAMSLANAGRGGGASTTVGGSKTSNVTINMGGRVDPLHLAREIAWAMG